MSSADDVINPSHEQLKMSLYPWFKPTIKPDGRLELKLDVMTLVPLPAKAVSAADKTPPLHAVESIGDVPSRIPDGSEGLPPVQPVHVASAELEAPTWQAMEAMGQMIVDAAKKQNAVASSKIERVAADPKLMSAIRNGGGRH